MPGNDQATTFARKMAAMDVIPALGVRFNTWFPVVMSVYCTCVAFSGMTKQCKNFTVILPGRLIFDHEVWYSFASVQSLFQSRHTRNRTCMSLYPTLNMEHMFTCESLSVPTIADSLLAAVRTV